MNINWKNPVATAPADVAPGDGFAMKVVAVVWPHDRCWCAYRAPSDWPDERVAAHGDQLLEEAACPLFYALANSGLPYYNP